MEGQKFSGGVFCSLAMMLVGSSFPASSLLLHYPYAGGQALRYLLGALVLLPLAFRPGVRVRPPLPHRMLLRDWGLLALLAATGLLGFNFAVLSSLRTSEPAVPGVIVGCVPIVLATVVPFMARKRPSVRILVAASTVVAGAAIVQGFGRSDLAGLGFALLALAGEAAFSLLAIPLLTRFGALGVSGYSTAFAAVQAFVLAYVIDGSAALRWPTLVEALALLWMAIPVTVVAFVCWYTGLQRIGPEHAGLFAGVLPLTTAITAPLVGTGTLGLSQLAGGAAVAVGLAFGLAGGRRQVVVEVLEECRTGSVGSD
jgi:drug/metabolite transporter (DMT)-like permease